ncbi:hypothetical protein QJQ45_025412 [Haematococcus lacustris]|nr:hypothetical protein QJQ45_025412 [Haematococcus lacustris]
MLQQTHSLSQPTKSQSKAQGKAAKAKPAPQPGRWLDSDCNAALNMQRIGESKWRPLELCYWPEQGALPANGKEYPGLGYKRLRDKPHTAQQQQAAEAQIGIRTGKQDQQLEVSARIGSQEQQLGATAKIDSQEEQPGDKGFHPPAPNTQPKRKHAPCLLQISRLHPAPGALPAKGKEYPGLGYKRLRDKPHTAQQQQPAEAQ